MTEVNPFEAIKQRKLMAELTANYAEAKRREARFTQTKYGFYDDEGVRQDGLIAFVRYFWDVLEPETGFVDGWPLWAICEHLEAVTRGDIHRLLINVPPGFAKSLLTDVFWPAWEWGPMNLSHYRYVTFSYSQLLTMRDNDRFRTLITSPKYQALYGVSTTTHYGKREVRNGIAMRNTQVIKVMNQNTGWKLASSTGGVTLGERGDRIIIDDPHNMLEAESDIERTKVIKWFRESVSSRLNDLDKGAIVIIMQRLHEDDVSGVALGDDFDYCHLMIPWEFDPSRAFGDDGKLIENPIGWIDPRADPDNEDANAGEPAWLERFSAVAIARMKSEMGPYAWASQMEQSPTPRGTGVFQPEWWKLYEHPNNFFPEFSFTCASLDGAFTQDETNDPSALTLWGIFDTGDGKRGVMLIGAWAKHLQFSSKRVEKKPMELHGVWRQRTMNDWGLMEWVYDSCTWLYGKPFKVDRLLIEDKGPGHSAAQELRNRYGIHDFGIQLVKTRGDKMARALAVQPIFSNGLVWAPKFDWSEIVIRQMSKFPYDRHDDLCLAAGTSIYTQRGPVSIERVKVGDKVITPYGWKQVLATHFMGVKAVGTVAGLTGTANHSVFTLDSGLVRMDSITQASHVARFGLCDLMRIIRQTKFTSMALGIGGWAGNGAIIYRSLEQMMDAKGRRVCTLRYGRFISADRSQSGTKFITRMAIHLIAALRILIAYRVVSIAACLKELMKKSAASIWKAFGLWRLLGINQMMGGLGIVSMSTKASASPDISQFSASRARGYAFGVAASFSGEAAEGFSVPQSVNGNSVDTGAGKANWFIHSMQPVYDLTVEDAHCYFANGVLVHNTDSATQALRYLRDTGLLESDEERHMGDYVRSQAKPRLKALYPV